MPLTTSNSPPQSHCRRPTVRAGVFTLALLALAMAGCSGSGPEAAFDEYLGRLARTLGAAPVQPVIPSVTALPAPRELHLEIQPGNLDALDFLALSGCAVQITIGKRNSSLGRLARDSQRLLLELEYLQLAPACIDYQREQGESGLADTLEQAWQLKRRQLPASIYNATLGSSEYRQFWKKAPGAAADYPANTSSAVIASLEAINGHARRWLAGDYSADNREFEILLGEVATGDGGALLQALAAQDAALAAANRIAARAHGARPPVLTRHPPRGGRYPAQRHPQVLHRGYPAPGGRTEQAPAGTVAAHRRAGADAGDRPAAALPALERTARRGAGPVGERTPQARGAAAGYPAALRHQPGTGGHITGRATAELIRLAGGEHIGLQ